MRCCRGRSSLPVLRPGGASDAEPDERRCRTGPPAEAGVHDGRSRRPPSCAPRRVAILRLLRLRPLRPLRPPPLRPPPLRLVCRLPSRSPTPPGTCGQRPLRRLLGDGPGRSLPASRRRCAALPSLRHLPSLRKLPLRRLSRWPRPSSCALGRTAHSGRTDRPGASCRISACERACRGGGSGRSSCPSCRCASARCSSRRCAGGTGRRSPDGAAGSERPPAGAPAARGDDPVRPVDPAAGLRRGAPTAACRSGRRPASRGRVRTAWRAGPPLARPRPRSSPRLRPRTSRPQ